MLQGVEQISSDELVADKVYRKDMGRYEEKKKEASFAVLLASACMLACWTVTMARCASPWCT